MCSSPKGSSQCFRQHRKKEFSRSEHEEHVSMMRRASAVYDRIEQEKAEKRQVIASQQLEFNNKKDNLKEEDKVKVGVFTGIKAFLLQPVF